MASVIGEKIVAGSVKSEIADAFLDSIPSGFKKKHAVSAAIQIWLSIPEDERNVLLSAEASGLTLTDVIERIVDRVLARLHHRSGVSAGEAQLSKPLGKPSKKPKSGV